MSVDPRGFLKSVGVSDEEIAAAQSQIDQGRAFLDEMMPLAVASTRAEREGDPARCAQIGKVVQSKIRAGLAPISEKAVVVIECLAVILSHAVLDAEQAPAPELVTAIDDE